MKVVIVGGVAGGATAAARIRRLDERAEIVVFERSGYVSYANCGLPYYIGGVIEDPEELTLQTPESFWERFRAGNGELLLKPGRRIFRCGENSSYNNRSEVTDTAGGPLRLNSAEAGASGRRKICITDWDGDGDLDIIVSSRNAEWFENLGEKDGIVELRWRGNVSDVRLAGHTTCPTPVDWDGNGVPDLLLGAEDGHFYLLKNNVR